MSQQVQPPKEQERSTILRDEGLSLLQAVTHLHTEVVTYISRVRKEVESGGNDVSFLVDASYLLRKIEDTLDASRKQAVSIKDTLGAVVGTIHTVSAIKSLQDGKEPSKSVYGLLAIGTPKPVVVANLPQKKSEEMVTLVSALLCDYPTARDIVEHDVLRIHWPTLTEILTKRQEEGLTPLPGIDPTTIKNRHTLVCRERVRKEL